jgi:hypothetical protein
LLNKELRFEETGVLFMPEILADYIIHVDVQMVGDVQDADVGVLVEVKLQAHVVVVMVVSLVLHYGVEHKPRRAAANGRSLPRRLGGDCQEGGGQNEHEQDGDEFSHKFPPWGIGIPVLTTGYLDNFTPYCCRRPYRQNGLSFCTARPVTLPLAEKFRLEYD